MVIIITFFSAADLKEKYDIKGKYLEHIRRVFPDYEARLKEGGACVAYFVGRGNASSPAVSLKLKAFSVSKNKLMLQFSGLKKRDVLSGAVGQSVIRHARGSGWIKTDALPPILCFLGDEEAAAVFDRAANLSAIDRLMDSGDYKGVCMQYAPLSRLSENAAVWDDPDILYPLGKACSKLSTTLLIKAGETKKLDVAAQYRQQCEKILMHGAALEPDSTRFETALAYRYYSNVHELMRPGERRDQNLDEQIGLANEWLSRALEIYPDSIRNNYRKGKLIIEKQVPHLLYGKKAFGKKEAALLREIRSVGEEHLGRAIALYEDMDDGAAKEANRREYAKALFVLGSDYLDDAMLPIHEYFFGRLADSDTNIALRPIDKLNIDTAAELLRKCFAAETDMPPDDKLDITALADVEKVWTRTPSAKLYRLGSALSAKAFIALCEGDDPAEYAAEALRLLQAAKATADKSRSRKKNTWHISERIAWTYIYLEEYAKAAALICRARAGYIINTYAIALLLRGKKPDIIKADAALKKAADNKYNLAAGLTHVLYAYTRKRLGREHPIEGLSLSAKNTRLAKILGVASGSKKS